MVRSATRTSTAYIRIVEVIWGAQPTFGIPVYKAGNISGPIKLLAHKDVDAKRSFVA